MMDRIELLEDLGTVADAMGELKAAGEYEKYLLSAFTAKVNRLWTTTDLQQLFDFADRDKLRSAGDSLPGTGPFTLYRGVKGVGMARRPRGFSWTDDLDTACWFAMRFYPYLSQPAVYSAVVDAKDVYAFQEREREFIVRPARCQRMRLRHEEMQAAHDRVSAKILAFNQSFAKGPAV